MKPAEFAMGATPYLNAGGSGSRLQDVLTADTKSGIAKALIPIGQPQLRIIDHHLNALRAAGAQHVVVGAGNHEAVKDYLDRRYSPSSVTTVYGPEQFGTGGDLLIAVCSVKKFGETVLVQNVDTVLDIDFASFIAAHRALGSAATIALSTRTGVPNEAAFSVDSNGLVVHTQESKDEALALPPMTSVAYRASSTGAIAIERSFHETHSWDQADGKLSLYTDVIGQLVVDSQLAAYNNGENFFLDIGTPQTLAEAQRPNGLAQQFICY